MQEINLRDFYPFGEDSTIEVSDEVLAVLEESERQERNHIRRMQRNQVRYVLDIHDEVVQQHTRLATASAYEVLERKHDVEQIYAALNSLPDKQKQRVYAYYILGIPQVEIARHEGVDERNVRHSISKGMENLKKFLSGVS